MPMIFSASIATPANIAIAKQSSSDVLLGFNEPNEKAQAANTVQVGVLPCPCKKQTHHRWPDSDFRKCTYNGHHRKPKRGAGC